MNSPIIYQIKLESPIGQLTINATENGICMLEFDNQNRIEKHQKEFLDKGFEIIEDTNSHINNLSSQLNEYFDSKRTKFDIPLNMIGTDFQLKVWGALLEIPFGITRTYKEQSIIVGDLKAIRAVATANGANKVSIIIPCHRVIGSDGSLTGYGGELWRKKYLLKLESSQGELF